MTFESGKFRYPLIEELTRLWFWYAERKRTLVVHLPICDRYILTVDIDCMRIVFDCRSRLCGHILQKRGRIGFACVFASAVDDERVHRAA